MTVEFTPSEMNDLRSSEVKGNPACLDQVVIYMMPVSHVFDGEFIYGHSKKGLKSTRSKAGLKEQLHKPNFQPTPPYPSTYQTFFVAFVKNLL